MKKTTSDVIIVGVGQVAVGEHWEIPLRSLAVRAMLAAIKDAGGLRPQALYVGNVLATNLSHQAHLGNLLADYGGLTGIEAETVEAGDASGGAALRQAYLAVKSGMVDVALAVGVEKFTDVVGAEVEAALATLTDGDFEAEQGVTPAAQAALLARRYQHEYDVPANGLAGFALTAHAHAVHNPYAMYRRAISLQAYERAAPVCEPLNLFDLAPYGDGAAAVILARRDRLPENVSHPLTRIAASAAATDALALHDRADPLEFAALRRATKQALEKAALKREQIQLVEYHDASSIHAALSLEASGFAPRGAGWEMAARGEIGLTGRLPCATMGGLKARGHAGGASGLYQAVEAVLQLRGQGGPNQIPGARYAMIQSLSGPASYAVVHILERLDA